MAGVTLYIIESLADSGKTRGLLVIHQAGGSSETPLQAVNLLEPMREDDSLIC